MGRNKKDSSVSREERMVISIAEIIQELISAHHKGKDVNLNKMKTRIASKYGLETSPRLVDIIAAVPAEYKKVLLPKLKAKPIRTASGISSDTDEHIQYIVLHPKPSPTGSTTNIRRRRPRWKHWETRAVLDVMKLLNMGNKQNRKRENFVAVEREIKKRGISRWNWEQIQQKWHNLRKDWINAKSGLSRSGSPRASCEFESELDELLECDALNWTVPARKVYRQVKVLSYRNIEDASELTDADAVDIDENVEGEVLPTAMLEDAKFLEPSHSSTRTSTTDGTAGRKPKKVARKGTGSYSAALSTFASVISARQEGIMKMMLEESSRSAEEEFRQQQEHDKRLVAEHATLLATQLANLMAENTQTILHGMASMMGLYLPLSQDVDNTEDNS